MDKRKENKRKFEIPIRRFGSVSSNSSSGSKDGHNYGLKRESLKGPKFAKIFPQIMVSPVGNTKNDDGSGKKIDDTNFLKPPKPKYGGQHRKKHLKRLEEKAIDQMKSKQFESIQRIDVKLSKSEALFQQRRIKMRTHSEEKQKEEEEKDSKDVLAKLDAFNRISVLCADVEYRINRFGSKHKSTSTALVIFLLIGLPLEMWWDYLAITHFEVPYMTFILHTGAMPCIHFCAILLNMYAYTMAKMKKLPQRITFVLGLGMILHPFLFFIRCWFEAYFDDYVPESSIHYDSYQKKSDLDPEKPKYKGFSDRFINTEENQPWANFVSEREYYFNNKLGLKN